MNFRELRSRNGHKAGGVVQAVQGDANVNRHQDRGLDGRNPRKMGVWAGATWSRGGDAKLEATIAVELVQQSGRAVRIRCEDGWSVVSSSSRLVLRAWQCWRVYGLVG